MSQDTIQNPLRPRVERILERPSRTHPMLSVTGRKEFLAVKKTIAGCVRDVVYKRTMCCATSWVFQKLKVLLRNPISWSVEEGFVRLGFRVQKLGNNPVKLEVN